jgi:alpha-tubulin suppressor-like RCC1 family protein
VEGEHRFTAVTAGLEHSCAVAEDGSAYCWGGNTLGELGDATTTTRTTPASVVGGTAFASIGAGGRLTCGVTREGQVYCWGNGRVLGTAPTDTCTWQDDPFDCRTTPVAVLDDVAYTHVAAGYGHTCAVAEGGTAYCWGENDYGQLGNGTTQRQDLPTTLAGDVRFATISASSFHACGLGAEGTLYCWGSNEHGQLGDGSGSLGWTSPVAVWGW